MMKCQAVTGRRRLAAWTAAAATVCLVAVFASPAVVRGAGLPTPPPVPTLPVLAPTPTPSPSGAPATSGGTQASHGTPVAGVAHPSSAATPKPGAAGPVIVPSGTGALIVDPALVAELNTVLNQPTHLQPPALRHFVGPTTPAGAAGTAAGHGSAAAVAGAVARVVGVLAAVLIVGTGLVLLIAWSWRLRLPGLAAVRKCRGGLSRRLHGATGGLRRAVGMLATGVAALAGRLAPRGTPRPRIVASLGLAVTVAGVATVLAVGHARALPPVTHGSAVASNAGHHAPATASGRPAAVVAASSAAARASWAQLVSIEDSLAAWQKRVALEEARITNLADQPAATVDDSGRGSGADRRMAAAQALAALLEAHQRTIAAYQASLQHEYDFYVAAAQNPVVAAAVTTAAAAIPDASAVVAYDLQAVSTQLQQESAITAAQAASAAQVQQQVVASGVPTFTAPVGGFVAQGFGPTSLALEPSVTYGGRFYTHFHTGIDISNALGTPVGAAAPGRVILAGSSRDAAGNLVGYGNYVVIEHGDGYITLYGHLEKLLVSTGQFVRRGQEIGLMGSTGWSTGPHLHFEIRHNGVFIDPETLLGRAVRG